MKTKEERYAELSIAFAKAIIDRLKELALKTPAPDGVGVYVPSTDSLKAAAFDALNEVIEGEAEPVSPMLAIAVWESEMKINESAHRQGLARLEKAGTLGFRIGGGAKAPKTLALQYV